MTHFKISDVPEHPAKRANLQREVRLGEYQLSTIPVRAKSSAVGFLGLVDLTSECGRWSPGVRAIASTEARIGQSSTGPRGIGQFAA
jgi:hypothetical protein